MEGLIVLALLALAATTAIRGLERAFEGSAQRVSAHVATLTDLPPASAIPAPPPPPAAPEPAEKPEPKEEGGGFWDKAKSVGGFLVDNFTPVGDIKTLLDPNASGLDKGLAVFGLVTSVVPIPGVGPAAKALTGTVKAGVRGVRDARRADRALDAADDAEDLAHAGKPRDKVEVDEDTCTGESCRNEGGKQCFAAGTLVYTEHGDRPIDMIEVGDRVWSRDPNTGAMALQRVLRTFVHDAQIIDLQLGDATRSERLQVTPNHLFWVDGAGWTAADALSAATPLTTPSWSLSVLASASLPAPATVYNLEVAESHTYFVSALHALVHNDNPQRKCPTSTASAEQLRHLTEHVHGLSEEQARSILDEAFSKGSSVVFGGSRVRGDFRPDSDLDVGFGSLSKSQAGKLIARQNAKFGDQPGHLQLESTRIVPGNETPNIPRIESPEEFFRRTGVRSDPGREGEPFQPSGSITYNPDGTIVDNRIGIPEGE